MNALTDADVLAEDKLFATLDTRTRRWQLPNWGPVLLSDTVGFIRDLPHRLIASFKATLEEARQADLLLHVADASNPAVFDQISAVYDVLEEIGIEEKDTLLVLNKIDAVQRRLEAILNRYPNAVPRRKLGLVSNDFIASSAMPSVDPSRMSILKCRSPMENCWLTWLTKVKFCRPSTTKIRSKSIAGCRKKVVNKIVDDHTIKIVAHETDGQAIESAKNGKPSDHGKPFANGQPAVATNVADLKPNQSQPMDDVA